MLKLCQCQNWDTCWFFCPIGSWLSSFSANLTHIFPFLFREMHRPVITLWKKELPGPRCHHCVKYKTMTVGFKNWALCAANNKSFQGISFYVRLPPFIKLSDKQKAKGDAVPLSCCLPGFLMWGVSGVGVHVFILMWSVRASSLWCGPRVGWDMNRVTS